MILAINTSIMFFKLDVDYIWSKMTCFFCSIPKSLVKFLAVFILKPKTSNYDTPPFATSSKCYFEGGR